MTVAMIFCSCTGKDPLPSADTVETEAPEPQPDSVSVCDGDFIITFSADSTVYKKSHINSDAPFSYKVTVEYVGENGAVIIAHDVIAHCFMTDADGNYVIEGMGHAKTNTLNFSLLEKGKPYEHVYTGKYDYNNMTMPQKGEYVINAYVEFSTEADMFENRDLKLDSKYIPENGKAFKHHLTLPVVIE